MRLPQRIRSSLRQLGGGPTAVPASVHGSYSNDGALGRTAGVSCLAVQEWEDRQCPYLLRYDDHAGPARSSSCNGIGYVVASQAPFYCSKSRKNPQSTNYR